MISHPSHPSHLLTPLLLLSLALSAPAAVYYVATNGNNSWSGTSPVFTSGTTGPWASIGKADDVMQPGDVCYVRGGIYSGTSHQFRSKVHGTATAPVSVIAYPGEVPKIMDINRYVVNFPFWISHSNHVVAGLYFANNGCHLLLDGAKHCVISNNYFGHQYTNTGGTWDWAGVRLRGPAQFNAFRSNFVEKWGRVNSSGDDLGSLIAIGNGQLDDQTYYNVIQGNVFRHGGHDCFQIEAGWNVILNNYFENGPWISTNEYNQALPGLATNLYWGYGGRIMKPGDFYSAQLDHRNVFDGNVLLKSGPPPDDRGSFGIELGGSYSIYRRNVIAFTKGAGIYINTSDAEGSNAKLVIFNQVYHNTIAFTGLDAVEGPTQITTSGFVDGISMTNYRQEDKTNNFIGNNILFENRNGDFNGRILSSAQLLGTNWLSAQGYPKFASTNGYVFNTEPMLTYPDFRLQADSPCIDAAGWLTTTTNSGMGTFMPVSNPWLFSDGNRIVQGDTIQLEGSTNRAVITAIDLNTGILTLASPLTWSPGQGVALAYSGAAPDFGAYEFAGGAAAPPPDPDPDPQPTGSGNVGIGRKVGIGKRIGF